MTPQSESSHSSEKQFHPTCAKRLKNQEAAQPHGNAQLRYKDALTAFGSLEPNCETSACGTGIQGGALQDTAVFSLLHLFVVNF